MTAYCGNHPDFPRKKKSEHDLRRSIIGNVEVRTEWNGNRAVYKEMKIKVSDKSWPMYVHFFTANSLSNDEFIIAERMFSSIKTVNK